MIETKNIFKSYKFGDNSLEVLRDINLKISQNEFMAIVGPSGAGKSTLLHILAGLDSPSSGEVIFSGNNLYALGENERAGIRNRRIGFVFQFFHLLPELNLLENVMLPAMIKSWWQRNEAQGYALELLGRLGLSARLKHKPRELSGGEQQRAAIARALINRPQVLFCDEPTGNLDSDNGKNIIELIKGLSGENNMAIVLVTHDIDIAKNAQRVLYLKDGVLLH